MVRNSGSFPADFRYFFDKPPFAIHVDTWNLARAQNAFVEGTEIVMADVAARPCTPAEPVGSADCRLQALVRKFGPSRGVVDPEATAGAEEERFTVMYFDFPGHDAKTWKEAYFPDAGAPVLADAKRVFVHPLIAEAGTAGAEGGRFEVVLQYWFFYPFNDGPNDHEGDWEHINVVISRLSTVERPLERRRCGP